MLIYAYHNGHHLAGLASAAYHWGSNAPPIFSIGALVMRVKYTSPSKNFYLRGAVTDGVSGDPYNSRGTHIKVGNGDGTLSIVEFGYTPKQGESPVESAQLGWPD